jgi:hypothetical protein
MAMRKNISLFMGFVLMAMQFSCATTDTRSTETAEAEQKIGFPPEASPWKIAPIATIGVINHETVSEELTLSFAKAISRTSGASVVLGANVKKDMEACQEPPCLSKDAQAYMNARFYVRATVAKLGSEHYCSAVVRENVSVVDRVNQSGSTPLEAVRLAGWRIGSKLRKEYRGLDSSETQSE